MRALDFFCGAGGLTRGLLDADIDVVAGVDSDDRCREAYERNNGVRFIPACVKGVDARTGELREHVRRTDDLLFAACAPCQPFSKMLQNGGTTQDPTLLTAFGRLVADVRPAIVLVENVPGITKGRGMATLRRFRRMLNDSGYRWVRNTTAYRRIADGSFCWQREPARNRAFLTLHMVRTWRHR